jgi:hypothetical protein
MGIKLLVFKRYRPVEYIHKIGCDLLIGELEDLVCWKLEHVLLDSRTPNINVFWFGEFLFF